MSVFLNVPLRQSLRACTTAVNSYRGKQLPSPFPKKGIVNKLTGIVYTPRHVLQRKAQICCIQQSPYFTAIHYKTTHVSGRENSLQRYIFSQGYSLYLFFFFAHLLWLGVWGFGVGVLYWVLGLGLSIDGILGLWYGVFWVFRVGALYLNIKE